MRPTPNGHLRPTEWHDNVLHDVKRTGTGGTNINQNDIWWQVEEVHSETGLQIGFTRPQDDWIRQRPFQRRSWLSKLPSIEDVFPFWQWCGTRVAEDGEDGSVYDALHCFRDSRDVGNRLSLRIWAGTWCMQISQWHGYVAVWTISNKLSRGSRKDANDATELQQYLAWWRTVSVFRCRPVLSVTQRRRW